MNIKEYIGTSRNIEGITEIRSNLQEHAGLFMNTEEHTGTYRNIPEYAGKYRNMEGTYRNTQEHR